MQIQFSLKKVLLFITHRPFSSPLAAAHTEEFKELVRAAGFSCTRLVYQSLKKKHPATLIGQGKIQEVKTVLEETGSSLVLFDHFLTGVQIRNLEREWKPVKVMDRNQLILDIFSQRAKTYAGKLQVELARHLDELPRMVGAWMSSLSRQGGGIGTKGPGEKAIEIDRRQVKMRAKKIQQKLSKIRRVREGHRSLRKKNKIPSLALVGYTNSGKSTLLNILTNTSAVATQNLPFMTLDPTTRRIHIPGVGRVLITDTVGFIQNLSPHLIEAFKATLEESASADILLNVTDLSSPLMQVQMDTVQKLLMEFGWHKKPCIHVYNKIDIAPKEKVFHIDSYPRVFVSALRKTGMDKLKQTISEAIANLCTEEIQLYFPKKEEEKIYSLNRVAQIDKKESSSLGTLCYARMGVHQLNEWKDFIISNH